jgi:tRNA dimethylallyltransferase
VSVDASLTQPRYLCLTGPTAAGKTAAALAIASVKDVEIVSVDSALVYRGMNIGTAKPTAKERAQVPHHLIDIRDAAEPYSAAQFVQDAKRLIQEISARGRLPLLVGGTLLYFKALFDGLDDLPPADPTIRATLQQEAAKQGWPALHAQLQRLDPITAARLHATDAQRIGRALEVYRITGQPLSRFQTLKNRANNPYGEKSYAMISLEPESRAWLHDRIAQRFKAMVEAGLLHEVQALRSRGDLSPDLPSMRCVGYRQAWTYLDLLASQPESATGALARFMEQGMAATRQLAKRQLTWLRSMPERHGVACDAPGAMQQVLRLASQLTQARA